MSIKEEIKKALDYCKEHIDKQNNGGRAPDVSIVFARNVLQSLLNRLLQ